MVGANGSALPNYEHEQNQRLNDHHYLKADRENEHDQTLNDHHSLKQDRENERAPEAHHPPSKPTRRVRSLIPARGPKPLLPRSLKEALQLASLLSKSKLVPKGFENQEACLVGILYGMEVGLSPVAAIQRMAIIDGRPTIWGDAALALVEASGLLIKIEETIETLEVSTDHQFSDRQHNGQPSRSGHQRPDQSDDRQNTRSRTAICSVLRSGRSEPITRTFSIEDAKRAGLWQKPGPWTDYPDRMLMMRARAFALRDAFPDVLMGLYLREEFEGVEAETRYAKPELGSGSTASHREVQSDLKEKSYLRSNYQQESLEPATSRQSSQSNSTSPIRRAPPPPSMPIDATASTSDAGHIPIGKEPVSGVHQQSQTAAENETRPFLSSSEILDLFDSALACANDAETLEEIREEFHERTDRLDTEGLQEAGRVFLRHEKRIEATERAFLESAERQDENNPSDDANQSEVDDTVDEPSGRIGKDTLSPHRNRRRFSTRPRKGLTLAELNARRKVDLLKYRPDHLHKDGEVEDE